MSSLLFIQNLLHNYSHHAAYSYLQLPVTKRNVFCVRKGFAFAAHRTDATLQYVLYVIYKHCLYINKTKVLENLFV